MLVTIGRSIVAAFSTFSRIPMPQIQWTEDSMRYSMCAFPLIGAVVAAVVALWLWICQIAGISSLLTAVGIVVCAVLISGAIHLDGCCDVIDALASHAEPDRKMAILKDSHVGAFAAIGIALFLLAMVAVLNELVIMVPFGSGAMIALLMAPIMGRTLSSVSVLLFPRKASTGMLYIFQEGADKRVSLVIVLIEFAITVAVAIYFCMPVGIAMVCGMLLTLLFVKIQSTRQFGGYNGDQAGYFLSMAELVAFVLAIVAMKVVILL